VSVERRESEAETLAQAASALLEPVYARLTRLAEAVVASRPSGGARWSESHLGPVRDLLLTLLREDAIAVGLGFVAAPGEVDGQDRYMAWWQRKGERTDRLRLNFDPTSIDVYDYLEMEWFQLAEQGRPRVAFGPYVDYSGAELYIVTATVPIVADGHFVGVAGVDLAVAELERRLLGVLRATALDAAVVSAERRVIAANTPRWVVGARLPQMPAPSSPTAPSAYAGVAELPVGTGWVLALAQPEEAQANHS
jgi:methyl-accepting chemotaxis protein-like sensor